MKKHLSEFQTHPNLHSPVSVGSNDGRPQREGTNLGVFVPIWLVLPRCEATNLGVFVLCHFALVSPHSNDGAVQIRVGLELAEHPQEPPKKNTEPRETRTGHQNPKGAGLGGVELVTDLT